MSEASYSHPHEALAAMTRSLQAEWNFLCRVCGNIEELLAPIEEKLSSCFLPQLTGDNVSPESRISFSLAARNGGLGVNIPGEGSGFEFQSSKTRNAVLIESITNGQHLSVDDHKEIQRTEKRNHHSQKGEIDRQKRENLERSLSPKKRKYGGH